MSKHRDDDELNQDDEFSLENILAEFKSDGGEEDREETPAPPPAPQKQAESPRTGPVSRHTPPKNPEYLPGLRRKPEHTPPDPEDEDEDEEPTRNWRDDTIPFPVHRTRQPDQDGNLPPPPHHNSKLSTLSVTRTIMPKQEQNESEDDEDEDDPDATKVLEFPAPEPDTPLAAGISRLRKKADEFAGHMFEDEGMDEDESVRRAEELIPGVDEEEEPLRRERRRHHEIPKAPDLPPAELARRYSHGLKTTRLRLKLSFLLMLPLLYLTLAENLPLPLPDQLAASGTLRCYAQAAIHSVLLLLCMDAFFKGLLSPLRFRMGLDSLVALANLTVLADAATLPTLSGGDPVRQPYCIAAALALWCVLLGNFYKRRGQRMACRTAAAASEPDLVTRDEGAWNGRDTYVKWSGTAVGFGSQIQGEDGAERIYRVISPLLLLCCILFSMIASLGHSRPEEMLWCLASTLTAASSLSATLCYGIPWRKLCTRLAALGSALAGWAGVVNTTGGSNLILTDTDLFPAGSISLNGVKIYGNFRAEQVVTYTSTVIREVGGGLSKTFSDVMRTQGLLYRKAEHITIREGGASASIRNSQVLVGSASFMALNDILLPQGLSVQNAVFCAIDGELAGLFALNYRLSDAVAPALESLICNHVTPVLATRDFNLIPSVLQQRFRMPADKMEFPSVERRRELSDPDMLHSDTLTAVLCREGVGPYTDAVVGGRRLRTAVRLSAFLTCLGSLTGILLAFYLTSIQAYGSLTPINLLIFLLMWLVPTPLLSGWVDRY